MAARELTAPALPIHGHATIGRHVEVDSISLGVMGPDAITARGDDAKRGQLSLSGPDETETGLARIAAAKLQAHLCLRIALARHQEVVTEHPEGRAFDIVEGATGKHEGGTRSIHLLTNLAGLLPVMIEILKREG